MNRRLPSTTNALPGGCRVPRAMGTPNGGFTRLGIGTCSAPASAARKRQCATSSVSCGVHALYRCAAPAPRRQKQAAARVEPEAWRRGAWRRLGVEFLALARSPRKERVAREHGRKIGTTSARLIMGLLRSPYTLLRPPTVGGLALESSWRIMSSPLHAASALVDEISNQIVSPPRPSAGGMCSRLRSRRRGRTRSAGAAWPRARCGARRARRRRPTRRRRRRRRRRGARTGAPRGARRAGCSSSHTSAPPSAASQGGRRRAALEEREAARRAHVGGRVGVDPAAERLGELLHLRVDQVRIAAHVRDVEQVDSVSRYSARRARAGK